MAEFLFRINDFGPSPILISYNMTRGGWGGMCAPQFEGDPTSVERFKEWAVPAAKEAKIAPGQMITGVYLGIPYYVYTVLRHHKRDFEVTGDLPEGYDAPRVVKKFLFRINDCELAPVMVYFEAKSWDDIGEPTYAGSPLDIAMFKNWVDSAPIEYWRRVEPSACEPSALYFLLRRHKRDFEVTGDLPEGYDAPEVHVEYPEFDENGNTIFY